MDRLSDIALFLHVLDSGSIGAAARHLNLSPAVASKRLQRLEHELGVLLFNRTTRRLHVTPEGAALAQHGRTLVEDLTALTSGLRQAGARITGSLRITTPSSFGRLYVSPLLPQFLQSHPDLSLSIHFDDEFLDLVTAGFDLAIRIGTLDDSRLVARKLATNRRILCASPAYLRQFGMPEKPADLERHRCLPQVGSEGRKDVWRLTDGRGKEIAVRVKGPFESNLGEALSNAAVAGLGITMQSTWHVCEQLRSGQLVTVLADFPIADTGIYALMPQRRLVPPRVRTFIEFLVDRINDERLWNDDVQPVSGTRRK